jgi:YVTN family beta-propeller protein
VRRAGTALLALIIALAVSGGAPGRGDRVPGVRGATMAVIEQEPADSAAAGRRGRQGQPPSGTLRLRRVTQITGQISPKSVVASQTGLFFAQNMMYRHTITVYDRRFRLVKTIADAVRLDRLGYPRYRARVRGAPVEAAFSPDGRYAYVSNYSMYGTGFGRPGNDVCSPSSGYDASFLYRIDVSRLRIDRAVRVGAVPKFVAVTPDDRYVLVANWCSYDLSVIRTRSGKEVKRLPLGPYPRGIAVGPAGKIAYVALMGTTTIARVDLRSFRVSSIRNVGISPRHLVIDPTGRFLYATLNAENRVVKIDLRRGRVVGSAATGRTPRSMAIAPDGRALYVVNYDDATLAKVRTRDMRVIQTVATAQHPIGVTYDAATRQVWVACYSGSILVFKDARARSASS